MASFLALFAFGTLTFWIITALLSIGIISLLDKEDTGGILTFLMILGLALWLPSFSIMSVKIICILFLLYVTVGGLWSVYKWWNFLQGLVQKAENSTVYDSEFSASKHKSKITAWIACWPWSVFWTLTHDIFTNIFNMLKKVYDDISIKAIAKAKTNRDNKNN